MPCTYNDVFSAIFYIAATALYTQRATVRIDTPGAPAKGLDARN